MSLNVASMIAYDLDTLADVMTRGFAGYFVDIQFTPTLLAHMLRQDNVDLDASRLVLRDDEPIGGAFIARRGWTSRVAAMGIVDGARGAGAGRFLMERLITDARGRGERRMVLEVIEKNAPAVGLYESCGFVRVSRLVGYTREQPAASGGEAAEEVDIRMVARAVACYADADLPWQISGETLAQKGPPARGYRLGPAYALVSDPEKPTIVVHGLAVDSSASREDAAVRLFRALFNRFPDKTWKLPPYYPESQVVGICAQLAFVQDELSQLQMSLALT